MPSTIDDDTSGDAGPERPRVDLLQVAAGALAATTAAVIGSRLGVNGTIIGAAVGSIVGTVGSTAYAHFLGRTATRVRTVVVRTPVTSSPPHAPTTAVDPSQPDSTAEAEPVRPGQDLRQSPPAPARSAEGSASEQRRTWRTVVLVVATTFLLVLTGLTVFELLSGQPLSSMTGGGSGGGTTVGKVLDPAPAPTPSQSPSPSPSPSQSQTPSLGPTVTSSESATPSPSVTTTTPSPTGSPTETTPPSSPPTTGPPNTSPPAGS